MSAPPIDSAVLSPAAAGIDRRPRVGWIAAGLFLATVLLFARALGHGFVNYDDPDYVTANEHVRAGLSLATAKWALLSRDAANWHPLTWFSHLLDSSLFGLDARGHHATSLILHGLNAAAAFVALHRLTGAFWRCVFLAALFAWHPLRVESVAWISERKDVLSGLFWFAALWAYAVYVEAPRAGVGAQASRRTTLAYLGALLAFAAGLMAKPMLVTLPCVLLLLDAWPLQRYAREGMARLVLEKVPFFVLAAASSWITYVAQQGGGAVADSLPLSARLGNSMVALVRYVGKFLWPSELAVLYPHPGFWPPATVAACAALVLGLLLLAWWQRQRRPWLLIGALWFGGTLVPVLGLVQVGLQAMADRYTYLPVVGLQLALVWTLAELIARFSPRVVALLAATVLLALAARTWQQLAVWRDSFTLFGHALRVTERNYLAHNNRGLHLGELGRVEESLADFRRALAIRPDYPEAANNLGRALTQQGRAAEAVALLRIAHAGRPRSVAVRNNLANALADTGAREEAARLYQEILDEAPRHVDAWNGLGVLHAMQGRMEEAKTHFENVVRLDPAHASAHANLGNVASSLGQAAAAAAHYARAVALNPRDAYVRAQLGRTYAHLGRREDALRELQAAQQLRPDDAQIRGWIAEVSAGSPVAR